MKKLFFLILFSICGIAYGAEDSWLTCIGKTAGNLALYPIKVIMNKGPRFLEAEAPGLYNSLDTPEKKTVAVTVSTIALTAGGLVLGPVSLVLAPVGVIALDYSYQDDE